MLKLFKNIFVPADKRDALMPCDPDANMRSVDPRVQAECLSHKNRGNQLLAENRLEEAAECYKNAMSVNPEYVEAYINLGYVLKELKQYSTAETYLKKAVQLDPRNTDALYMLGSISRACGDKFEAIRYCSKALDIQSDFQVVYSELCQLLFECGRLEEAKNTILKQLSLYPESFEAHNNLGIILLTLNQYEEALVCFDEALSLKPDYADAFSNRGAALSKLDRHKEALESFEQALHLQPNFAEAFNNRGNTLLSLNRPTEALTAFEQALAIKPEDTETLKNHGVALSKLSRQKEALAVFNRVLTLKSDDAEAFNNRGNVLFRLNRYDEALIDYEMAASLKPDFADAHFNASLCRLVTGDFEQGWAKFEWRWNTNQLNNHRFPQPLWLGKESLKGKTILLHAEQGLGDTIQFCRYSTLVAEQGATVLLEVQPALKALLAGLDGVSQILVQGEPRPRFDYHCPLMSLPLAFNTQLDSIVANTPYIFSDPNRVSKWETRLGRKNKRRIGLVWSGNPDHKNDYNRSMPLEKLLTLISDQAQFVCLQKEVRDTDKRIISQRPEVIQLGHELKDFADTAALIDLMDIVISVDTSVAHLAGALGKPVWVLLPFSPDWRWLLERNDSPWYPSAQLFRQPEINDWDSVIAAVAKQLNAFHNVSSQIDYGFG